MLNWKALIYGFLGTLALLVLMQLIFIFAAILVINLTQTYPAIFPSNDVTLRIVGLLLMAIVLLCSGYFTAYLAQQKVISHAVVAASSATLLSLVVTLDNYVISTTTILLVALSLLLPALGAKWWLRRQNA